MNELENILKVLGLTDFKEAPGIEDLFGFDKPTHKEEPKPESKTEPSDVAGIAALVSLLKAATEAAEEDKKSKEPVKGPAWKNEHAHADRGFCDRSRWATHQYVDEMIKGLKRKDAETETKKNEKISLEPAPMIKNVEIRLNDKLLKDFPFEKKRKLVLHDTVKQEAEELAQSHKKILDALSQLEPDKMDYRMIKEMVKYIDILHSVRCSAERVASILTND